VVPRPSPLIPVGEFERAAEGQRMRARKDRQRRQTLGCLIRDLSGKARAPIVTDKMEPPPGMAERRDNGEHIRDQMHDPIAFESRRIRPRAGGITTLVLRRGVEPRRRHRPHLRIPEMSRNAETMQHQDKRRDTAACHRDVEHHSWGRLHVSDLDHRAPGSRLSEQRRDNITYLVSGQRRCSKAALRVFDHPK
jgi:hypothetical protein